MKSIYYLFPSTHWFEDFSHSMSVRLTYNVEQEEGEESNWEIEKTHGSVKLWRGELRRRRWRGRKWGNLDKRTKKSSKSFSNYIRGSYRGERGKFHVVTTSSRRVKCRDFVDYARNFLIFNTTWKNDDNLHLVKKRSRTRAGKLCANKFEWFRFRLWWWQSSLVVVVFNFVFLESFRSRWVDHPGVKYEILIFINKRDDDIELIDKAPRWRTTFNFTSREHTAWRWHPIFDDFLISYDKYRSCTHQLSASERLIRETMSSLSPSHRAERKLKNQMFKMLSRVNWTRKCNHKWKSLSLRTSTHSSPLSIVELRFHSHYPEHSFLIPRISLSLLLYH